MHGNSEVTPDQVIVEFNRKPGRNNKCQLAMARFKVECCLTGLVLNGRTIKPDEVVRDFPVSPEGRLGLARFKEECCLMGLVLGGQQVMPDAVVRDYQAANATLELARFKAECCLKGLPLGGQPVPPDAVVRDFPDSPKGKLGAARFKEQCCLMGLSLKGRPVPPDAVVEDFPENPEGRLGLARFKAECCLRGLLLTGQPVTPEMVVKDFPDNSQGKLGLARFRAECCLKELSLYGRHVIPDTVVKDYQAANAPMGLACFKAECCLMGLALNGQPVTPDAVVKDYQAVRATLKLTHFKAECCLRGLVLNGRQVTPDAVVKDFQAANAPLGLARFKEDCCLRGLVLHGQQVAPDEVVNDYRAARAPLELARFKEACCLRGLALNSRQVSPDEVVKAFQSANEALGLARFKQNCCLQGLALNGQPVTPAEVVNDYRAARAPLELARFKEECCLRGLALNGQQVAPDEVVKAFQTANEALGLARFKQDCCLLGLVLNGQPVTPDEVVNDYRAARAPLELARFKAECCLRGLVLKGRKVTPYVVVKAFPDNSKGRLGIARFKELCCLSELPLNGQQVSPDAVIKGYPNGLEGQLAIARFKAQCCLMGLVLQGQPVTPEEVVNDFPGSPEGKLGMVRFKEECCLRGLTLNGQQVTPDAVVKDFERGGWLLERAIFYAKLALNALELNGNNLDNQAVLAAFNQAPGDHSLRQAEYLMQSLKQRKWYDETNEAQGVIQQAWQILNSVSVNDEQQRLQCILKFTAMEHELSIDHQRVSAEEVLQSITTLRNSFRNKRIHFFFLAHCYITGLSIDGQKIHPDQVLQCLQGFPKGSNLRFALESWFAGMSTQANTMSQLLFEQKRATIPWRDSPDGYAAAASQHKAAVVVSPADPVSPGRGLHEQATVHSWSSEPGFLNPHPQLNALMLQTLGIIQEINDSYRNPPLLITGSYARFLQNLCASFNDIDIVCTMVKPARILFARLRALNTDRELEIPKRIVIWPIQGCQEIKLPKTYNIHLKDGDLGMKAMGLQVSIDARVTDGNAARLAVHVPGVERLVWCLSFAEETRLLNSTLDYLADNLDPLTMQLQRGELFSIPRTILFNLPQNRDERIYGLLMRSLLTLNKARQFITLHAQENTGKPDSRAHQLQEERQRLDTLAASLQTKLHRHAYRNDFERRVNDWLSTTDHVNDYEIKRKDFIRSLLAMMHPDY